MTTNILDFIEVWWNSQRLIFESAGVTGRFERTTDGRPKPSCKLTLRRNQLEADLVVWESGEAELGVIEADGSVSETHFDDLRNHQGLDAVLGRFVSLMPRGGAK